MSNRLTGKTAFVTAAGQGIGHAAVMAMVAEGATVWATDVNPELLKGYAGVANVHTAVLDVMNKDDIQKQVALIPRIDALFNCAGVVHGGTIRLKLHALVFSGVRCAEVIRASKAMPKDFRVSKQACITGRSESEPMTIATNGVLI